MKESFILYTSQYTAIRTLSLTQKGRLLDCMYLFALGEDVQITDDPVLALAFAFVKERMEYNAQKYEEIIEKRREAGRKGNMILWGHKSQNIANIANATNASQKSQKVANVADIVIDSVIDIDSDISNIDNIINKKEKDKKEKRFVPPTVEDVDAYCRERGNSIDAEQFVDFYSAKGWMMGSNRMKDWKSAVRTWERRGERKVNDNLDTTEKSYWQ